MFSVSTISVVICLCAMVQLSESWRDYRPGKIKDYNTGNRNALIPMTDGDKKEIIKCHNDARSDVDPEAANMQKMTWSDKAEENAKNVVSKCKDAHSAMADRQAHGGPCGENLYLSSAKDTWTEAIKDWMSEGDDFTYDEGGNGNMVGHYTQVVWAETNQVGCARAKCDNLQFPYLYVCHYCPAGNNWKRMARPYEAGEPCSKCKGACQNNLCV